MKKVILGLCLLQMMTGFLAYAQEQVPDEAEAPKADSGIVAWYQPEALTRLLHSNFKTGFFQLSNHYESQTNRFFCGPTSATIVLNSLRLSNKKIKKPIDPSLVDPAVYKYFPKGFNPLFEKYTQNSFFNEATDKIKTKAEATGAPLRKSGAQDVGLSLEELQQMLIAHGLDVKISRASDDVQDKAFIEELKAALQTPNTYVIANYARPVLFQKGSGHISPVAAYDQDSDSFLIMDVNPLTAPWVWVPSSLLIKAMRKWQDTVRGFVVIREGTKDKNN